MATTKKKRKRRVAASKKTTARRKRSKAIDLAPSDHDHNALEMKGHRLVVRLSRDSHPEVFEIDKLVKQVRKTIATVNGNRKMRDFREFLEETEKSLQIILSNHLEDALRKYLG